MGQKLTLAVLIFLFIFASSLVFSQEQITVTTYYPSPFGSYRDLRSNRLVVDPARAMPTVDGNVRWGAGKGELTTSQGSSIELGGSGTPYIDISNDLASDYDFRIILMGNNRLDIRGGETYFTNDDGTWARVRLQEVYFCAD